MVCPLAVSTTDSVGVNIPDLVAEPDVTAGYANTQTSAPVLLGRKPPRRRLQNAKVGASRKADGCAQAPAVETVSIPSFPPADLCQHLPESSTACDANADVDKAEENDLLAARTPASSSFQRVTIVFDWDDTLLPSSWLKQQGVLSCDGLKTGSGLSRSQQDQLVELAKPAVELVRKAKTYGTVLIITSADQGWVQATCHRFLPALEPLLENIAIVCARTCLASYPGAQPSEWKRLAFRKELLRIYQADSCVDASLDKHVISIGDGPHERDALFAVAPALQSCHAKSVKLFDRPDICELSMQQTLIAGFLSSIVQHVGNLDLSMQDSCGALGGA